MRNFLTLLLFTLSTQFILAQEETFTVVEEMPIFNPGVCGELSIDERYACSQKEILTFVMQNVAYPQKALDEGFEGKIYVKFIVDTNGKVVDVNIAKGGNSLLESEAIRVIKSLPDFIPGVQRGENVKVQFIIPINFKLQNDYTTPLTKKEQKKLNKANKKK